MSPTHNFDLYDQLEDLDDIPAIRNVPEKQLRNRLNPKQPGKQPKREKSILVLAEQENEIKYSYNASKHEKAWLTDSLTDFFRQHWFDDILRLINGGGKEAAVYQCLGNETINSEYLAAKVYRPRKFRQLRNDSLYREGRLLLDDDGHLTKDDRALHAIEKRTDFGKRLLHTSWIEHEFQTMRTLYAAGANVPQPYASGNNAILMEYIGWDDVAAPTLNTVKLSVKESHQVFDKVIHNVEIMLDNQRVHADLSAYNILYFEQEIYLIDFPQSIEPESNRNAYTIFRRDILRLCEYFQDRGLRCRPGNLAESLWRKHGFDTRPSVHPGLLEPEISENR